MRYRRAAALPHQTRLRNYLPTLVMLALCTYFAFYLLFGPRGFFALQHIQQTLNEKQLQYDVMKDKRDRLEADVKLMRPNSLDPDMAEEQARKTLGYMKPDEIVIDLN